MASLIGSGDVACPNPKCKAGPGRPCLSPAGEAKKIRHGTRLVLAHRLSEAAGLLPGHVQAKTPRGLVAQATAALAYRILDRAWKELARAGVTVRPNGDLLAGMIVDPDRLLPDAHGLCEAHVLTVRDAMRERAAARAEPEEDQDG